MNHRQFKKACSQSMRYLSALGYDASKFYLVNAESRGGENSLFLALINENNSISPAFELLVDYLNKNANDSVNSLNVRHVFTLANKVINHHATSRI